MKIALIVNLSKEKAISCAEQITRLMYEHGASVLMPAECKSVFSNPVITFANTTEDLFALCDTAVTVGGDGTIIHGAKYAAAFSKPIIGVNVGRLGFAADVEIDEPEGETYDGYQKAVLTIDFPISCVKAKFLIDIDFVVREIQTVNVINDSLSISADDEPQENTPPLSFFEGSEIKMSIRPKVTRRVTKVILIGYNPNSTAEHVASDKITANG